MTLLERDRESAAGNELIEGAIAGRGGLLIVQGPVGSGKSTLLAELSQRAAHAGVTMRSARATRLGGGVPFGLARRLLEPAIQTMPAVLDVGWARHARPVFEGAIGGAGDRRLLVEGLVALVAELCRAGAPLALSVDDVQWGDAASLEFLEELAARCEDVGVTLAVAIGIGHGDAGEPSLRRLAAIAGGRILAPEPLSVAAVRDLVRARLPDGGDRLATRIAHAAGGNPLLVTALIESAERHGADEIRIPDGLAQAVLMRLTGAGPHASALAEAIAVLGEAPLRLGAALAELEPGDADRAADELIARHVLAAGEPVRFRQPLLAELVSATIAPFELAARHRRAAELWADDGADAERVAAHLLRTRPAGEPWVCDALRTAARAAITRGDPVIASELLARALAEPPAAQDRGIVTLELARSRAAAGLPEATGTFEAALITEQDPARRGDAWRGLSRLLYARGEFSAAAAAAARGRAELPEGHPLIEGLVAAELAAASNVPELAREASERLDALADGEPPAEPMLLALLPAHMAGRVKRIERVRELAQRAVAANPLIDPESHGIALIHVAGALNWVDELALAEAMLDRGLACADQLGDPLAEVNVRFVRAWSRIYRGRLNPAAEDLDAILAAGELGWRSTDALCAMPLIVLRLERGDLAGARDALDRAPREAHIAQAWYQGAVALAAGDPASALSHFQASGAELEAALGVVNPAVVPWRTGAALAAWQLGDLEQAGSLSSVEVEQARAANVGRALGVALRTAGRVGNDPALLHESVAVLEQSPARLELARSLMFAGVAQHRGRDTAGARVTLSRAFELAIECDAPPLVHRTLTELRAAGARPRQRPRTGPASLTAGERQTAELAAAGRTTRQIAAALFLSPKTVEGHLTSTFRKLQISSRSELNAHLRAG